MLSAADNRVGAVFHKNPSRSAVSRITPSSPPNPTITNGRGEEAGATSKSRSACDETDRRESEGERERERERVGRVEAGERKKEKDESCRVFVEKSLNETRRRRRLVGGGGGKHAED